VFLGVVAWSLAGAFVLAVSFLTYRAFRTNRPSLNALAFHFLTVFVPTAWLLPAGLAGILRPWPLAVFGAVGFLVLGWWPATRRELIEMRPAAREMITLVRHWWQLLPRWLRWLTGLALVASAARFAFLIWVLPPFTWDSLTYHLVNVAEWVQRGRITMYETPVSRIWSPANYEVFATWFTLFLQHDVIVEASGLPAYLLACLAVYAIGRTLGLGCAASLLASLGYASTPALLLATTATKNDPIMAGLFLMMMAIGLDLAVRPEEDAPRNRPGQVILLISVWLLALGTKPYILHLTPGLVATWALAYLVAGRKARWSALPGEFMARLRENASGFRVAAGWVLVAGLTLGLFWYVRNGAQTGNPFFPYGVTVGSVQVVDAGDKSSRFELAALLQNLEILAERFGDKRAEITPDLPYTTGWGWVAYGLGLPALAWSMWRRPAVRVLLAGFVLALVTLLFSSPSTPYNMRYAIWFPALLCLAVGFAFDGVLNVVRPARAAFGALFVVTSALNFLMMLNYNAFPPSTFFTLLEMPTLQRESSVLPLKVPQEYSRALEIIPGEDLLGFNVHGNGFTYPLYRADYSQRLVYIPIPDGSTCESIASSMEQRGTRYLFVAPEHTEDWILTLLNTCATKGTSLRERVRGLYVVKRD